MKKLAYKASFFVLAARAKCWAVTPEALGALGAQRGLEVDLPGIEGFTQDHPA